MELLREWGRGPRCSTWRGKSTGPVNVASARTAAAPVQLPFHSRAFPSVRVPTSTACCTHRAPFQSCRWKAWRPALPPPGRRRLRALWSTCGSHSLQAVWMGQNCLPTQRGRQPCPLLVPAQLLARPVGPGAVSVRLSESLWVVAQGLQEGLLLAHVLQEARRPRDGLSGCEPWCRLRPGPVLYGPLSPRPGSAW